MFIQDYDHTLFLEFCEPGIAPRLQGLATVAYPGAPGQRIVTSLVLLSINVAPRRDDARLPHVMQVAREIAKSGAAGLQREWL